MKGPRIVALIYVFIVAAADQKSAGQSKDFQQISLNEVKPSVENLRFDKRTKSKEVNENIRLPQEMSDGSNYSLAVIHGDSSREIVNFVSSLISTAPPSQQYFSPVLNSTLDYGTATVPNKSTAPPKNLATLPHFTTPTPLTAESKASKDSASNYTESSSCLDNFPIIKVPVSSSSNSMQFSSSSCNSAHLYPANSNSAFKMSGVPVINYLNAAPSTYCAPLNSAASYTTHSSRHTLPSSDLTNLPSYEKSGLGTTYGSRLPRYSSAAQSNRDNKSGYQHHHQSTHSLFGGHGGVSYGALQDRAHLKHFGSHYTPQRIQYHTTGYGKIPPAAAYRSENYDKSLNSYMVPIPAPISTCPVSYVISCTPFWKSLPCQ